MDVVLGVLEDVSPDEWGAGWHGGGGEGSCHFSVVALGADTTFLPPPASSAARRKRRTRIGRAGSAGMRAATDAGVPCEGPV